MQSFSELNLSAPVQRAITDLGYEKPSQIQAETLPILLGEPTDFLGLAATGTGKTAAFGIPMVEKIDVKLRKVQGLILCPTRELALQVAGQLGLLGKHKGIRTVAIYGGASYNDQIFGLQSGASVVVGTPGRVMDHLDRGTLKLDSLKMLVLDEADEMISMGFKDELEKIMAAVPRGDKGTTAAQFWLFSATMSKDVRHVADDYLRKPKMVQVNRTEVLATGVEQYYYSTHENDKPEILCKLIEGAENFYGLIFCQTKALVVDLTQFLHERGYRVDNLHGDKDQSSRERTMQSFRDRKVQILVCTDVASRGLDVKDITHVINYSLPRELDNYVHRIGRTARSGKTGIAMNLVTPSHRRLIYAIEKMTKSTMLEGRIPSRREIGARKVASKLASFNEQAYHTRAVEVMSEEWRTTLAGLTPEEVAGRFLTLMMPEVFNDRDGGGKSSARKETRAAAPAPVAASAARPRAQGPHPALESVRDVLSKPTAAPKPVIAKPAIVAVAPKPAPVVEETPAAIEAEVAIEAEITPGVVTAAPVILEDAPVVFMDMLDENLEDIVSEDLESADDEAADDESASEEVETETQDEDGDDLEDGAAFVEKLEAAPAPVVRSPFAPRERRSVGDRPTITRRADAEGSAARGPRPSFNRRPEGGDRPSFNRRSEGGDRPTFGRRLDRDDRPSFARAGEERPRFARNEGDRPSFNRRPEGGDRPRFGSARPSFNRDGGGDSRPSFGRPRGDEAPRGQQQFRRREDAGPREQTKATPYAAAKRPAARRLPKEGEASNLNRRERRALKFGAGVESQS